MEKLEQIGRIDSLGTAMVVCFLSADGWTEEKVTGIVRSLDDDMVQIEVAPPPSADISKSIAAMEDAPTRQLSQLFIPWAAIRSMAPA